MFDKNDHENILTKKVQHEPVLKTFLPLSIVKCFYFYKGMVCVFCGNFCLSIQIRGVPGGIHGNICYGYLLET